MYVYTIKNGSSVVSIERHCTWWLHEAAGLLQEVLVLLLVNGHQPGLGIGAEAGLRLVVGRGGVQQLCLLLLLLLLLHPGLLLDDQVVLLSLFLLRLLE